MSRTHKLLLVSLLLLGCLPALAQTNPNEEQGLKPYDSLHGGDLDSISLTNGGLVLHIPLASFPQRGNLDLSFMVRFSSKQWYVRPRCVGMPPNQTCTSKWLPAPNSGIQIVSSADWWKQYNFGADEGNVDWTLAATSPDGYAHLFGVVLDGPSPSYPLRSLDATGLSFLDANTLVLPNGTRFSYMNGRGNAVMGGIQPSSVTDANGNQITFTSSGWTDTLGRVIPGYVLGSGQLQPGVPTSDLSTCPSGTVSALVWNVPGMANVNSGIRTYKFCYANFSVSTNFNTGGQNYSGTMSLLTAVVLPDLTTWTFSYDNYADVTRVGFPTGGSLSYTYVQGPITCSVGTTASMAVTSRTVDANDGTGGHTWNYSYSTPPNTLYPVTTTATAPDGNQSVHTATNPVQGGCGLYETQALYYQGTASSGAVLRTVSTQYSGNVSYYQDVATGLNDIIDVVPTQVTTTLPGGHVSKVVNTYDASTLNSYGDPVIVGSLLQKDEYDFSNALARSTLNHFLWQDNATYKSNNLISLPVSTTVKDGSANQIAQTTYGYDQTAVTTSGITTQLVAPPAGGNIRGNQTTGSRWLNTTGSFLSSTATYFDTGMRASSTDPLAHTTTYAYSSSFADAYMTQTNMPDTGSVHHIVSGNYDFNTGLLTSFTDQNGQPYSYQYDIMLRLTQGNHPDTGRTVFNYANPTTVERQRLIATGSNAVEDYFVYFDGLGRKTRTQQVIPNGNIYVDTAYDALGRIASASNPHFSTVSPTDGITQTQYDALNRTTQIIPPDGTAGGDSVSTAYSDNCVTATDEAGKARKSCVDALGRLIEVDEPQASSVGTSATASVTIGGSLQVANSANGAPPPNAVAGSALTGYVDSSGSHRWLYFDANGHMDQLIWSSGAGWTYRDGTLESGSPVAVAGSPLSSFIDAGGAQHWCYLGTNQHVYQITWSSSGGWFYNDPTALAGSPVAAVGSGLTTFQDSAGKSYWVYEGTNQHLYQIYWSSAGGIGYTDMTATAGSPVATTGSPLTTYIGSGGVMEWAYLGTNQHVYQIWSGSPWGYNDPTALAGSPAAAAGSGLTTFQDSAGKYYWAYEGTNQHLYQIYWSSSGGIGYTDMTATAGSPVATTGSPLTTYIGSGGVMEWAYLGTNQNVYQIWNGSPWGYNDPTSLAGSPVAGAGSGLTVFEDSTGMYSWVYEGANQHLYAIYWSSSSGIGYTDMNASAPLMATDSGTVSLTVGSFTATACFGSSTNSACTGQPVNNNTTQVASALAQALNTPASPVTASATGATISLTWKTPGAFTPSVGALSTSHDNSSLFPNPSFTSPATSFSGGGGPSFTGAYTTLYTYDVLNNLLTATQQGGTTDQTQWRVRTFTYDSLSRLIKATNPESGTICYGVWSGGNCVNGYDANGNLTSKTDARGITTTYSYDALNRPTGKSYSNGDPAVSYTYDQNNCLGQTSCFNIGQRTGMTDAAGSEAWSYDPMGHVLTDQRTTSGVTKTTTYTYNLLGGVTSLTNPSGRTINYAYDSAARPLSAVDQTSGVSYASAAAYAPTGVLASLTDGSGVVSTFFYNTRLEPCRISVTASGTSPGNCNDTANIGNILDFTYNFSAGVADSGNVTGITNNRDATRSQGFTYDALNRVATAATTSTNATSPAHCWGEVFGYDPFGNLHTIGQDSQHAGCSQEALAIGPTGVDVHNSFRPAGYQYDAAGNLTLTPAGGSYAYNAESKLTSANGTSYVYDGDGKRVKKANSKVYWYGTGSDALDETDASGNLSNEYIFFKGERIARRDSSGNVDYYLADHLGTARVVTNASGAIQDDSDFYPFGGERTIVSSSGNAYKFTGKERDTESGLDDFGARYYGSTVGRFMTPDPIVITRERLHNPEELNSYAYVQNNPLRFIDPTGMRLRLYGDRHSSYQAALELLCEILGPELCPRLYSDAQGNVYFNTSGLDLSKNEGAALINALVQSLNTYGFSAGPTVETAGGTIKLAYLTNLDNSEDPRYNGGKRDVDKPPAGIDDIVAINPNNPKLTFRSLTSLKLASPDMVVFHELAEAFAKIDGGKSYKDAHNEAMARENVLRDQRPYLKEENPGSGGAIGHPDNDVTIKQ